MPVFSLWVWRALSLIAFIIICADTYARGWDFDVFYNAAHALLRGESPYQIGRDSGWTYKYPPWSVFIFIPFTVFSLTTAKFIWGLCQCVCLVMIFQTLRQLGLKKNIVIIALCPFWFLIHHHALSGQINLLITALTVGVQRAWVSDFKERIPARFLAMIWALSLKVFSIYPVIGLILEEKSLKSATRQWMRPIFMSLVFFLLCSLPIFIAVGRGPFAIFAEWMSAASILSSQEVAWAPSRSWNNAGLPGFFLKMLEVPHTKLHWDILSFLGFGIVLGALWYRYTQKLNWNLRWSGWLALGTIIHPLVWMMSYVQAIPLACFALHEVKQSHKKWRWFCYVTGMILTTLITSTTFKFIGIESLGGLKLAGLPELISIKAWGVLLVALSVVKR